jgi:hypothetical protein
MSHTVTRHGARLGLAAAAAGLAFAVAGVGSASAAPAATEVATSGCYMAVINDWLDNNRVDKLYAIPCYTQAIQKLNSYPDVQNYSSAADDIHRALLAAIRQDRGNGSPPDDSGGNPSGTPAGSSDGTPPTSGPDASPSKGFFHRIADKLGPSDAQSVPLPLLVLGGLALLLLATAGATWLARRLQARRMPPPATKRP